jgi:hypothetical protein
MAARVLDPALRLLVGALARAERLPEAREIVRRNEATDETVVDLADDRRYQPAVREAAQALADSRGIVRCRCGETGGDRCPWVGPKADTVRVRWVDPSLRGTAEAAGYPQEFGGMGGVSRRRVVAGDGAGHLSGRVA